MWRRAAKLHLVPRKLFPRTSSGFPRFTWSFGSWAETDGGPRCCHKRQEPKHAVALVPASWAVMYDVEISDPPRFSVDGHYAAISSNNARGALC